MADPGGVGGPSREDIKNVEDLNKEYVNLNNTLSSIASNLKVDLTRQMRGFDAVAKDTAKKTVRDLNRELENSSKSIKKSIDFNANVNKTLLSSKKIEENIASTKSRILNIENLLLEVSLNDLKLSDKQVENVNNLLVAMQRQLVLDTRLLEIAKQKEESLGNLGKIFKGIAQIPIVGQFINAERVLRKMEDTAERTGSKWRVFGAGIVETFKSLGSSLADPLTLITGFFTLFKKIIDLVLAFDKKTYDIAKNLGVGVSEARQLQSSFLEISRTSANLGLSLDEVVQSYTEISNTLGFLAPQNREFSETAALIQKRLGLSAEAMGALVTQSALSGKYLMDTYKTVQATRVEEGARQKLNLSLKQIIDGVAKVSSTVLINFKGSDKALESAVIRAVKLGISLEQINKQGETLLDFESSISSEFEAQLLTGRDLNLTRARELALMGNTRGLMEELNKQNVKLADYENMNVIQRQAFAKAVGLSTEELSKQLIEQEKARKLGAEQGVSLQEQYSNLLAQKKTREEIAVLVGKDAEADLYKASRQDKLNNAIDKLKNTIADMVEGPIGEMLDSFAKFVSNGEEMKKVASAIKTVFGGLANVLKQLPEYLGSALNVAKLFASISIASAVANVVGGFSKGGPAGAIAGIIAGVGTAAWLYGLLDGANNAPAIPSVASSSPSAGLTPLNTSAAFAQTTTTANEGARTGQPVFNLKAVTMVGTENWSSTTRTSLTQDSGTTIE